MKLKCETKMKKNANLNVKLKCETNMKKNANLNVKLKCETNMKKKYKYKNYLIKLFFITNVLLLSSIATQDFSNKNIQNYNINELEIARHNIAKENEDVKYFRKEWHHWIKVNEDCQNTRQKVLIRDSKEIVKYKEDKKCHVEIGKWLCPYTGEIINDPKKIDIDHVVPLAEAHRSGGYLWDREKKELYANDLKNPTHLLAVKNTANREKGDKDPAKWLPIKNICTYIYNWVKIKNNYKLTYDKEEFTTIENKWKECEN